MLNGRMHSLPNNSNIIRASGGSRLYSFFTSHSFRAYVPITYNLQTFIANPACISYFRMIAAVLVWISVFFFLSGYVCAVKALRLSNGGQSEEARKVVPS